MGFRFIDLFCGIGGMRIAFERVGGRCVFSSDWDKHARQTYFANFGETPQGDIREVDAADVPAHDVLIGGFPCQPFSISGVSKKNSLGRPHGFADKTQGTLFFEIARIIDDKRPSAIVLENVKNLISHDRGRTLDTIYETLETELGYHVYPPVLLNAKRLVPQNRERVFIVGFREPRKFVAPVLPDLSPGIGSILEKNVEPKYVLSPKLWAYLQNYADKHKQAGNGFGYGLIKSPQEITRTLSARYYKDGSEILIPTTKGRPPRRLTPRECARLMGFPDSFKIVVSDTQAYRQFGNSVVVPVVEALARQVAVSLASPSISSADEPIYIRQRRLLA
jgi:DNA (cytosine-5)-methyltransferase 1